MCLLALALLLCCAALCGSISAEEIERVIGAYGAWAPAAYMLAFAVLPTFFFPVAVLALAGGVLFGLGWGSVYTFCGAMLNCSLMFALSRHAGRQRVEALLRRRLAPAWQERLSRLEGREGFLLLIVLRLIPAVPYNLINYAFGLVGMPYGTYLLGSAIGIIPGTLAFINIGDKATEVGSSGFWTAMGLLAALLAVTTLLGRRLFPQTTKKEREHEKQEYK